MYNKVEMKKSFRFFFLSIDKNYMTTQLFANRRKTDGRKMKKGPFWVDRYLGGRTILADNANFSAIFIFASAANVEKRNLRFYV